MRFEIRPFEDKIVGENDIEHLQLITDFFYPRAVRSTQMTLIYRIDQQLQSIEFFVLMQRLVLGNGKRLNVLI
ncbi:hypothetical protein EGJ03_00210 [Stenotrophomonas maltophilia]|nr:hypothetical protein EGJ06_19055 [Stenotrophomonas maltophilia]RRU07002.1 hypothetical protein EGJ77_19410 [Stenotrophomonas maltophilia]RRU36572.1 hypothetical protein EGJ03_00210 [Stenotrophomonas maltophilia]RRU88256.1 hypothetical protein EGI98_02460 [Stenotrophomonas maltophilia]RRU90125.1 hypothetical protein EGI91_19560 [Stenotrophomonas maltophilia]